MSITKQTTAAMIKGFLLEDAGEDKTRGGKSLFSIYGIYLDCMIFILK